jgi:hypothetical protein
MKRMGKFSSPIHAEFPLYSMEDYDAFYPHHLWKVGIKSTFPSLLKKRLIASVIATQMGTASVDYVIKRYLDGEEEDQPLSMGAEANTFIEKSHDWLHGVAERLTHHADDNVGRIMAELTMMRQQYTTSCFLYMANRGAVFEGYSLLRMQLEQFAWILAVDRVGDPERVRRVKAQSSLRVLDGVLPGVASLYGQFSAHAHWSYDAHVRAITSKEGKLGVLFASVNHKAELLYHGVFFVGLFSKLILKAREAEISDWSDGSEISEKLDSLYADALVLAKRIQSLLEAGEG